MWPNGRRRLSQWVDEGILARTGKPLKDHQEVIGHTRAIDILYATLNRPTTEDTI